MWHLKVSETDSCGNCFMFVIPPMLMFMCIILGHWTDDPKKDTLDPDELALGYLHFEEQKRRYVVYSFIARYVRKVHSDSHIAKMLKKNKSMTFLDLIGPSDIAYAIAVVKNGLKVWRNEPGAKPLFTHGEKKKRGYGQCMWSAEGKSFYEMAKKNWTVVFKSKIMGSDFLTGWERWLQKRGKGLNLGTWNRKRVDKVLQRREDADSDEDNITHEEEDEDDENNREYGEYYVSDEEEFEGPAYEGMECTKQVWSKVGIHRLENLEDEEDGDEEEGEEEEENMEQQSDNSNANVGTQEEEETQMQLESIGTGENNSTEDQEETTTALEHQLGGKKGWKKRKKNKHAEQEIVTPRKSSRESRRKEN